jgi:hypothetical protein
MILREVRWIVVGLVVLCSALPTFAQTTANWSSAGTGNWTDGTKWSTNPSYPNNDTPAGATYWANIAATGSPYQIFLNAPINLTSATLSSPDATVNQSAGSIYFSNALNLNAGTWLFTGTTATLNGTINGGGGVVSLTNGATATLNEVTLAAPLQTVAGINRSYVDFHDLTLAGITINLVNGALQAFGSKSNETINGNGTIFLAGSYLNPNSFGTLTISQGITVAGTGTVAMDNTLVNHGFIGGSSPGAVMDIHQPYVNDGTFAASNGGTFQLLVDDTTTQAGTVMLGAGSTLTLTGNVTESRLGTFVRSGGTVNIQHLDNTGHTTALNDFGGGWNLYGPFFPGPGAIIGGTITTGGGIQQLPVTSDGFLQDVYFDAGMIVSPSRRVYLDDVTINGTLSLQGGPNLQFVGTQTLNGTAQIRFDGTPASGEFSTITDDTAGSKITFGPNVYIRTGTGSGTIGEPTYAVLNQGIIDARTNGEQIHIAAGTFENAGQLWVSNYSTLTIDHMSGDVGSISLGSGGVLDLNGSYSFGNQVNVGDMAALTLRGNWSAADLIRANHGTINLGSITPSISQLTFNNSVLGLLLDQTTAQAMTVPFSEVTLRMAEGATLDNSGATLMLGTNQRLTALWLANGRVKGGTIAGDGAILVDSGGATLDGVTSAAPIGFFQPGATLTVANGLTLNNASISLFGSTVQSPASQTIGGTGAIVLESGTSTIQSTTGTLTLGSGITTFTRHGSGSIGVSGSNVINLGTISSRASGQTIALGLAAINSGTVEARDGGVVTLPYTSFTSLHPNFNHGSLSSGNWAVYDNSTITLSTLILRNDANVLLSGPNSFFGGITSLRTNNGTFTIDQGKNFTTVSSFTNNGTLRVGADSTFRVNGSLTNTGTLDVNEFAIIDYAAGSTSPIDTIRQQILAGRDKGAWDAAGIIDSNARADSHLAVGFADANQKFTSFPAPFAGQSVDDSAILIRETYGGDANLDGAVTILDFNLLAANFGKSGQNWYNGDFDYDGTVGILDFNLLAASFGHDINTPSAPAQAPAALRIDAGPSAATVPLPSQLFTALCTLAGVVVASRRMLGRRAA